MYLIDGVYAVGAFARRSAAQGHDFVRLQVECLTPATHQRERAIPESLSIWRSSSRHHGRSELHRATLAMLEMAMIDTPKHETEFLLRRAEEEAILAIRTDHPDAAAAHFDMSLRYGERARDALTSEVDSVHIVEHASSQ